MPSLPDPREWQDESRLPGTDPANFLEARFWIASGLPTTQELSARIEMSATAASAGGLFVEPTDLEFVCEGAAT